MNRTILEPILRQIFDDYNDKQNLSFKMVKKIYNQSHNELNKDEAKLAKEIIMDMYLQYENSKENAEPSVNESNSKKRVREQSAEKSSPLSASRIPNEQLITKPEGKKQKFEVFFLKMNFN